MGSTRVLYIIIVHYASVSTLLYNIMYGLHTARWRRTTFSGNHNSHNEIIGRRN